MWVWNSICHLLLLLTSLYHSQQHSPPAVNAEAAQRASKDTAVAVPRAMAKQHRAQQGQWHSTGCFLPRYLAQRLWQCCRHFTRASSCWRLKCSNSYLWSNIQSSPLAASLPCYLRHLLNRDPQSLTDVAAHTQRHLHLWGEQWSPFILFHIHPYFEF